MVEDSLIGLMNEASTLPACSTVKALKREKNRTKQDGLWLGKRKPLADNAPQ